MNFEPTVAQKKAVEITDQNMLLAAGAGSGKTRVLVQRYIHLLKEKLTTVDQILAITFTNKAAQEMQTRIREEVFKLATGAKSRVERVFWQEVLADLMRAQITTFHGFCGQILRLNPLIGINPSFRILDEVLADELLEQVIEDYLLKGFQKSCPELTILAKEYGVARLEQRLKRAYLKSRSSQYSIDRLTEISLNRLSSSQVQVEELKSEVVALIEELLVINDQSSLAAGTKKKLDLLAKDWSSLKKQIMRIGSLRDRERKGLKNLQEILKGRVQNKVKKQHDRLKEIIGDHLLQFLADLRARQLLPAINRILKEIDSEYTRRKNNLSGLDFTDLEQKALQILKTKDDVCHYFSVKYQYIMVDEFQDTNPSQAELIDLLVTQNSKTKQTCAQLFVVGDPQQSIYRFRGADVTVFKRLQRKMQALDQEILLDVNFRSRKQIIDFVNYSFSKIFGSGTNPYDLSYRESIAFREDDPKDICVQLLLLDPDELKAENLTSSEEEAVQIAQWIQQMVVGKENLVSVKGRAGKRRKRPLAYGDICLLFQTLSHVEVYEELFQRSQIPCMVVNGRGFFQRQEVRDLVNLLQVIDNPHLQLEWAGVLRSPFCGLSDDELFWVFQHGTMMEILQAPGEIQGLSPLANANFREFLELYQNVRTNRDKKAISLLVNQLLKETGYWQVTSVQSAGELIKANLEKVLLLARRYEQDPHSSLAGFMRYLEKMDQKGVREGLAQIPGENNLVKMMTIHQSKGLEFPVVILVESQRQLFSGMNFPTIVCDSQMGMGLRVRDPLTNKTVATSLYRQIIEVEEKREIAERKRLFYVAATRAQDYLLISGFLKSSKAIEIDEGKSWLDWLRMIFDLSLAKPKNLHYGSKEEQQIRLSMRQQTVTFNEVASTSQPMDFQSWQEIYQQLSNRPKLNRQRLGLAEFTVSELVVYQRCPRWYYYQFQQQIPANLLTREFDLELFTPRNLTGSRLISAADRGSLIHFICQHIESLEELSTLIKGGFEHLNSTFFPSDVLLTQIEAEIYPYIEIFLRRERKLKKAINFQQTEDWREFSFNVIMGESLIKGTIDRVLLQSDQATIIDYKSNKITLTDVDRAANAYRLQAQIYALAIYHLTGIDQIRCKFHFLIPDEYRELIFTKNEFSKITVRLTSLQKSIIRARLALYPPVQPAFCSEEKVCPYFTLCNKSGESEFIADN